MIANDKHMSADRIFLMQAKDYTGNRAYYFVHVNPIKLPLLKEAISKSPTFDICEYGEIITSGYGEVPDEVKAAMQRKYGWQ